MSKEPFEVWLQRMKERLEAMKNNREDLCDIRVQDRLRRELSIVLGQAVIDAIESGLQPDSAMKAVEEVYQQEQRCAETRKAFERTYA